MGIPHKFYQHQTLSDVVSGHQTKRRILVFLSSVGEQEDIDSLARETDCLPSYVAKGVALGCFVYARCLHHGLGADHDEKEALRWYSRVCILSTLLTLSAQANLIMYM